MNDKLDRIQLNLLSRIADIEGVPQGAYNIRLDGQKWGRNTTANIDIVSKDDKDGIDIIIKSGTKNESVHIPVLLSQSGLTDMVYNDFIVGDDCDVTIVAGCGIHNGGGLDSRHDGIHRFFIGKNSKVKYIEKHYGEGDGNGKRIMNPTTQVKLGEGSYMEMDTAQIRGVDSTVRKTSATLAKDSTLVIGEKIYTHGNQTAITEFELKMDGEGCSAHVSSRSVAGDNSKQTFFSKMYGNAPCNGRTECDAIIMDDARVSAVPEIKANHPDASLVHEAAIGRIAGEQLTKLMTLGLSEKEAEEQIISGFLK